VQEVVLGPGAVPGVEPRVPHALEALEPALLLAVTAP
jgi:hypothetical protein